MNFLAPAEQLCIRTPLIKLWIIIINIVLWTFLVTKAAIKITVTILHFPHNVCYIWWFFRVLRHIWHTPFWKIIKYSKKFGENEEKSFNYSITLKMAAFGTKNVYSTLSCQKIMDFFPRFSSLCNNNNNNPYTE